MTYPKLLRPWLLALAIAPLSPATPSEAILDFTRPDAARGFRVINDGVMGGVSSSRLDFGTEGLLFTGSVSMENNGGFASFRGPLRVPAGARALLLTVRGDGQVYRLTLKPDDSNATGQYQASFTVPREWTTLRFVPTDFSASFRGRALTAPTIALGDVQTMGLLIADKQVGAFRIEVRSIGAE